MNSLLRYLVIFLFLTSGCESRKNLEQAEKKLVEVKQKEQELLFKEKTLQLKEEELRQREAKLDSSMKVDTTNVYNAKIIGNWSVKMTCIETTCVGFAVGDTKNETWNFSHQQNSILAKAMAGNSLVRVYSGKFSGTTLELSESSDSTLLKGGTKMIVRLNIVNDNTMEGRREILRENECKVTYELELVRKQSQGL